MPMRDSHTMDVVMNGVVLMFDGYHTLQMNSCLSLRRRVADGGNPRATPNGSPRRFAPRDDNQERVHCSCCQTARRSLELSQ
jgi:hypothetical protein